MNYEAGFDEKGRITWTEQPHKAPDLSHLQGAFFIDHPELWRGPPRKNKARSAPLPGQPPLHIDEAQKGEANAPETC